MPEFGIRGLLEEPEYATLVEAVALYRNHQLEQDVSKPWHAFIKLPGPVKGPQGVFMEIPVYIDPALRIGSYTFVATWGAPPVLDDWGTGCNCVHCGSSNIYGLRHSHREIKPDLPFGTMPTHELHVRCYDCDKISIMRYHDFPMLIDSLDRPTEPK